MTAALEGGEPRPYFTPGKDPVPIVQEAGWAPGPVWTGGKSRPYRDSIPDRPARSQSLCRLSYPTHRHTVYILQYVKDTLNPLYAFIGFITMSNWKVFGRERSRPVRGSIP